MEVRKGEQIQVDQKCPVCGNGYMRPNGIQAGNQYEHSCNSCGFKQSFPVRYPYFPAQ
jgi:predicted RNA-binding Zn-ribbon protein involved in translation (DUF1610 family)